MTVVTDKHPRLKARKVKFPHYEGARRDLTPLILKAKAEQEKRNAGKVVAFPAEVQKLVDAVPETAKVSQPETVESPKVVPLRRAVITSADVPAETLTDVVLDESNKRVRAPKAEKIGKRRDNRYARAFRALLENPEASVAQQAKIADVTEEMFRWYHITFRHVDRLLREKFGDECIPPLPELND
jgi:hypothetical protein